VGSSATWAENAVCATLNVGLIQMHDCAATGRYIFIVLQLGAETINFREFQVVAAVEPPRLADADAYGCVLCDAGRFCPGNGTSLTCSLNTWSAVRVNAGPCDACAVRSFALAAGGMVAPEMCQCTAGAEGSSDRNCSLCAAGSFQSCDSQKRAHAAEHNATCMARALALGNRAVATATRCEPCPANFYSGASGASSCAACPANASSATGSDSRLRIGKFCEAYDC